MVTVLTPTYNRAYILENAYYSLLNQTDLDFEWIIVDDGSSDKTGNLVYKWIREGKFPIKYYKIENGGKHRAVNYGVKQSNGEFILILDSDDVLTTDAVEFINKHLEEVSGDSFAGLSGLKGWNNKIGTIGNQTEDDTYVDATNIERAKLKLLGDKAEIYKRSIMIDYPFPEFEGEKFIRESAVWDKIALDGYKLRWYNHVIYRGNYLEDGLTRNLTDSTLINNFQGFSYCTKLSIIWQPKLYGFFTIGNYIRVAKKKGLKRNEIQKRLEISISKYYSAIILINLKNLCKRLVKDK